MVNMNDILKGCVSFGAILAGGSVAYHFVLGSPPQPIKAATESTTPASASLLVDTSSDQKKEEPSRSAPAGEQLEKIFYAFATGPNGMKSPAELAHTFNSCERSGPDPDYDGDSFAAEFLNVASGWDLHIKCKDVKYGGSDVVWQNVDFDNSIDLLMETGPRAHVKAMLVTARIVNDIDIPDTILAHSSGKLCDPQAFDRHIVEVNLPSMERYWALSNVDSGSGGTWGSVYFIRDDGVASRLRTAGWKPC